MHKRCETVAGQLTEHIDQGLHLPQAESFFVRSVCLPSLAKLADRQS